MIKTSATVDVTINMTLDIKTARWLQGVMQNPLHGQHPSEEPMEEEARRKDLFLALKAVTDNHA